MIKLYYNEFTLWRSSMSNITKKALETSFRNLLMSKPLHKITINDITDNCGVNRMTFYYHFKDIYDLVDWMFTEDAEKVLNNKGKFDTWQDALVEIFNIVLKNKIIILNVYHSMSHEKVENYLNGLIYNILKDVVDQNAKNLEVMEEDKEFIANFYKYAFTGVILNWIKTDMKLTPQIMAEKLMTLIEGNIVGDLISFKESNLSKQHK